MRGLLLTFSLFAVVIAAGQTPDSLIAELRTINGEVAGPYPAPGKHLLLSNRALNIFLSEAAGYYLSSPDDLTLYKNSVIANSAEGTVSIYHNPRQAAGIDSGVRSFLSFGAQVNAANAYNASFAGTRYKNQFGFLVKYTWVGKPHVTATPEHVKFMDVLRANILHTLEGEIRRRAAGEEAALAVIDTTRDIPGQDAVAAKAVARKQWNVTLRQQMEWEWANEQADTLARTFSYKVMAFHWTSVSCYIPLITENFAVAAIPGDVAVGRHGYPLYLNLTHTRLWEGSAFGRIYGSVAGDLLLNNSHDAYALAKTGDSYFGDYSNFVTPTVKAQFIYFPAGSHIGISFLGRQAFGPYHTTDAIVGLPIVLINKQAEPAINFEFQLRLYDLGHTIIAGTGFPGHSAVGLTIGIPFSKIAY